MDTKLLNHLLQQLDPALEFSRYEIDGDILRLFVQSTRGEVACPACGMPSARKHSAYRRAFRDLPMMGKKVEIVLQNRVFCCDNPECSKVRFSERFACLKPFARKTDRLWDKIMDIALNISSVEAAATLRNGIADVSKSSICEREKEPPPLADKTEPVFIGIDDWAKHKRETYGTIVVDMDSHRVLDLVDSREKGPVGAHLSLYSNVVAVCRDGSQSYRAAISQGLPDAIQVSDYFHLVKGLIDALKTHLIKVMPANIPVPAQSDPDSVWMHPDPENAHDRKTREREERKAKLREKIVEMDAAGTPKTRIAKALGISAATVRNYLSADFSPKNKRTGKRSACSTIGRYAGKICRLYEQGVPMTQIHAKISADGFEGGYWAVQNFLSREKKRRSAAGSSVIIERKKVLSMLYRPYAKYLQKEEMAFLQEAYPDYAAAWSLLADFRALFEGRNPDELVRWLEQASEMNMPALNSFVHGVTKDIEAVQAAILLGMTSGLVEGSVNKLKVIKRIMYGRCSFALLRSKTLHIEARKARRDAA